MINRARSEHCHMAESLAKIKVIDIPLCQCSQSPQNINHVLWQCTLYDNARKKLITKLEKINLKPPLCVEMLISHPMITACKYIVEFIRMCNLKV